MSQIIWGQVLFVLASLCNGMLLMTGYDVVRLFRWLIPRGGLWLWLEDILYWSLAAVPTFYLFFSFNEGIIRWYGLLGILAGAILYETGISIPVRNFLGRYANPLRRKLLAPFQKGRQTAKQVYARRQKRKQQKRQQKKIREKPAEAEKYKKHQKRGQNRKKKKAEQTP